MVTNIHKHLSKLLIFTMIALIVSPLIPKVSAAAPTITLPGITPNFTEDGGPVLVASGVTITDTDGSLNSATIELHYRMDGKDEVLDATITGTSITKDFDDQEGILYLTGPDTPANFQQVIETLTYDNKEDEPDDRNRTIEITVYDDSNSDADDTDINIISVNDAPEIKLNGDEQTHFYQGSFPVIIDPDLTVADSDDTELEGATITLDNHPDLLDEYISIDVTGTDIEMEYDANTFTLTLSELDAIANYQKVLRTLTYNNTRTAPDIEDRHVSITVNDGDLESDPQTVDIDIKTNTTTASIDITDSAIYEVDLIDVKLTDNDANTHGGIEDEVEGEALNMTTGEIETFSLIETEDGSAIFEGAFRTTDDQAHNADNNGYLYVQEGDTVVVSYLDSEGPVTDQKDVFAGAGEGYEDVFPDIEYNPLREYIINLYNDGIVKGYSDGTYRPDYPVSRGEMASFIVRAFDLNTTIEKYCFADLPVDHVHRENILILCNMGIVSGYSDGTYRAEAAVKRDQITKFISLTMQKRGMVINWAQYHEAFPDVDDTSVFYQYIAFLTNSEYEGERIIKGYSDGNFKPSNDATRAEMAKMIDLSRKYFEDNV
ncbi:hypothetical protein GF362_06125 [Candidatus Dojkabacteria bacterium]|nr:hypothetical protein [Candidatus Dojkabacteria bacterium]